MLTSLEESQLQRLHIEHRSKCVSVLLICCLLQYSRFWDHLLTCSFTLCPQIQAIINSTITPNMTFTKTSQKFGQWADSRANTVYGLGFSTEQQLQQVNLGRDATSVFPLISLSVRLLLSLHPQFADQFKEVKEAARLAREKSQERFELAHPALSIAAPQVTRHILQTILCWLERFLNRKWKLLKLMLNHEEVLWGY